jgi:hypothetical protein
LLVIWFSSMSFVTQVDSLTWPGTVPLGWSVEWDPSPAGNDPLE